MKLQLYLIMATAALGLLAGAFAFGYHKGSVNELAKIEKQRIKTQEQLFDLGDDIANKAQELLQLQKEKEDLIYELEKSARNAIGSGNPGVGANGGLQRLDQRWGPSPKATK